MSEFESFLKGYYRCFTNNIFSIDSLKNAKILTRDENFFFIKDSFIIYFINEARDFNLPNGFIKIVKKIKLSEIECEFLRLNGFKKIDEFIGMSFKNNGLRYEISDEIELAILSDIDKIYSFFTEFFDKDYLFINKNELKERILNNQVFVIKNQNKIIASLIYFLHLNIAHLDFMAVNKEWQNAGFGRKLMAKFLSLSTRNFKLFVRQNSKNIIDFYSSFGFVKDKTFIEFYGRDDEG
ncbi:hypothetical protein CMCT_0405 [Campylobacter mucosalis]|uniref:GNAT family N-acetyltransferase n=1 Tax=Campylobacter mucosalis TaxID=202 RepID=UPI00069228DA|nr:GNAT family N-acetyltransferase [Campylobacter mucosalis]QKF62571.1 hypothetical protein CMCT_0405 [Campylobacter mucosalis]